jgi:NADPH-dependent 2,4-dienoyl-CoA reductase/sulfur reductase-like enzyme
MPQTKYLIVGGGMTADAAVEGIRQVDPNGSIGLISAEPHRPYDRPPLSKGHQPARYLRRGGRGLLGTSGTRWTRPGD